LALQKLGAAELTTTGQMLGTPSIHAAGAIYRGAHRTDAATFFSLGVILYWMATGEVGLPGAKRSPPFPTKVVHTEPVAPRNFKPGGGPRDSTASF